MGGTGTWTADLAQTGPLERLWSVWLPGGGRGGGGLEDGAGVSDGIFIWGQCCKGHPDI